jgi:hypothetical protein
MFDPPVRETARQRTAAWLPALAGLMAAAGVAWFTRPAPSANSLTWSGVAELAARYVLLSAFAGLAVSVASTALLLRGTPLHFNLRFVAATVWLPPLALFVSQGSIWAGIASVAFGWHLARSRRFPEGPGETLGAPVSDHLFQTFRAVDSLRRVPSRAPICSAVCLQNGALIGLLGQPIVCAAFLGAGSIAAAWAANDQRPPLDPDMNQRGGFEPMRRALLRLAFAILFTLAGLMQYLRGGGGGGSQVAEAGSSDPTGFLNGTYKGVILLPEPARHPLLVPPLPFMRHDLFTERRSNPLSVPFFGAYWLYRWPQSRPPPDSYVIRGSPLKSVFRSSDRIPLSMEAHQNFGTLIDLSCCSQIQIAITSTELNSRSVALELILTNTTLPGRPSQSLGSVMIEPLLTRRTFDGMPSDLGAPLQAVLSFDVPRPFSRLTDFDEATVLFHRGIRLESAKVAIDRFIFVPREVQ